MQGPWYWPKHNHKGSVFQRKRVFYTRANISGSKGQLLVIVDSGCTDNLISEEVVKQMKWQTTPHPQPYAMGWVNEGHEVLVNRQVMVPFEIGTYREEVQCDVFPMGVCDLLLGRPWQYDRDILHEGKINTYTVRMAGKSVRLWPMTSEDPKDYVPIFRSEAEGMSTFLWEEGEGEDRWIEHVSEPQEIQQGGKGEPALLLTNGAAKWSGKAKRSA